MSRSTQPHTPSALARIIALVAFVSPSPSAAQAPAAAAQTSASAESSRLPDRPSIDFGHGTRLELRARVQSQLVLRDDSAGPDGGLGEEGDRLTFDRGRFAVAGAVAGRVQFQLEREVGVREAWRDAFVDVRLSRAFQVRGGHFKVPFSREQLASMYELDFTTRSAAVAELVPLRAVGVMTHGIVADRAVRYQAGLFEQDRSTRLWASGAPRLMASRVTVAPLTDGSHRGADTLQMSVAWLRNPVADGRNGPEGHLVMGQRFFDRMYTSGRRTMLGGGAVWSVPAVTVAGELLRSTYAREGQAISGGDLSDLVTAGGYASGAWHVVRGKGRRRGRAPLRELDATGRYDWVNYGSVSTDGPAFRNPRADHVPTLGKRTLTFGTTWRVNRWVTVNTNVVRERVSDPLRLYDVTRAALWSAVIRSQVVM